MTKVKLSTGIWYNDHQIELEFPSGWQVQTLRPNTPPALTETRIKAIMSNPVGQPPLRELLKDKKRPLLVIDDLARPTPVFRIMPFILQEVRAAGLSPEGLRILVATGTHGHQNSAALSKKIGPEAYQKCKVLIHNDVYGTTFVGKTSFGTPVYTNAEIKRSDFVFGVGGIYPQHTTGFGGGSKLALGVSGRKTIVHLHFGGHRSVGGTYDIDNTFRQDLDEIARMIGLNSIFTLHIDGALQMVNLTCGDHFAYYREAAAFSYDAYKAPLPHDADVVIANTYPSDVSYTFMRKGLKPLRCASADAVRIAIGYLHEGIGQHGIFPQGKNERLDQIRTLLLKMSTMDKREIIAKIKKNLFSMKKRHQAEETKPEGAITVDRSTRQAEGLEGMWLYRPTGEWAPIPCLDGINIASSWEKMIKVIEQTYPGRNDIRVAIYPCGSLQCLDHTERKK